MRKLWLFLILMAFIGTMACPLTAEEASSNVIRLDPYEDAQMRLAKLRELQAKGDWLALQKGSREFVNWAKQYKQIEKLTLVGYDFLVTSLENQGRYAMSADAVREKDKVRHESGNIDKVMTFEQKHIAQVEYHKMTMAYHTEKAKMQKAILEVAQAKEKLTKELLDKKNVTKDEIKALQEKLRELSAKVDGVRKEMTAAHEKFLKDSEKYREQKLLFNPEQRVALQDKIQEESAIARDVSAAEKQVRENLVKISEQFQVSWNGLEEKLNGVKDIQNKLMKLQEELLALLGKTPISEADKKVILAKQAEMDKLIAEEEKLYADLEKAFMDAKIFDNMNNEQAKKFMELFKVIRDAKDVIAKTDAKIDELIKKMQFQYGDLNGDGKLDKADLNLMIRRFLLNPLSKIGLPNHLVKAADLDGDGKVTWSDYHLLAEAVNGSRKVFPVQPENQPGDFNGNGSIDEEDVLILSKVMNIGGDRLKKAWKRIADLNGDGKVDAKDMIELVKKIGQKVEPQADTASGSAKVASDSATVATDSSSIASGTGNATGNTPTSGNASEGQSAGNMNQGF